MKIRDTTSKTDGRTDGRTWSAYKAFLCLPCNASNICAMIFGSGKKNVKLNRCTVRCHENELYKQACRVKGLPELWHSTDRHFCSTYSDLLLPCLHYLSTLQANKRHVTYKESLVFSEFVLPVKQLSARSISALYQNLQLDAKSSVRCNWNTLIKRVISIWNLDVAVRFSAWSDKWPNVNPLQIIKRIPKVWPLKSWPLAIWTSVP